MVNLDHFFLARCSPTNILKVVLSQVLVFPQINREWNRRLYNHMKCSCLVFIQMYLYKFLSCSTNVHVHPVLKFSSSKIPQVQLQWDYQEHYIHKNEKKKWNHPILIINISYTGISQKITSTISYRMKNCRRYKIWVAFKMFQP